MAQHPRAHLLTGEYGPEETPREEQHGRLTLLRGLAHALCRRGDYAVIVLRDRGAGDLGMIGVEHPDDATKISRAVRARKAPPVGSWGSHRSFDFDAAAYRRIALALLFRSPGILVK